MYFSAASRTMEGFESQTLRNMYYWLDRLLLVVQCRVSRLEITEKRQRFWRHFLLSSKHY